MPPVHIAITRQVKLGSEQVFEETLREFARKSLGEPGTTGVQLISPVPGTHISEYGVLFVRKRRSQSTLLRIGNVHKLA